MTEKRNVRANETRNSMRDEQARPEAAWKPPSLLDAPEARPGYTQRWISTSIQGKETPDNVYKRMREGWEPRFRLSITVNGQDQLELKECCSAKCLLKNTSR